MIFTKITRTTHHDFHIIKRRPWGIYEAFVLWNGDIFSPVFYYLDSNGQKIFRPFDIYPDYEQVWEYGFLYQALKKLVVPPPPTAWTKIKNLPKARVK